MKIFFVILFTCAISFLSSQTLDEDLNQIFIDQELMGMSVVVVEDDSVIFSKGYGLADYEREIPVTDSTIYRIASISKSVTATALMQLYDAGLFQLDEDISDYLGFLLRNPDFPDTPITFRMLLSHTSSIQDGTGYSDFLADSYTFDPPPHINSLLTQAGSYYTSNMFRNEMPGSYFAYSNVNYGIIGTLIEKISETRFDIYCRQEILEPLNLKGSFNIQDISNLNNIAVLYRKPGAVWVPQADNFLGIMPPPRNLDIYPIGSNAFIFAPQGGLRISANDLSQFMLMHLRNGTTNGIQIITDTTAQLMHTTQWEYDGSNGDNYYGLFRKWGLGFHLTSNTANSDIVFPSSFMIGHPGEAYGLISDMYFNKDLKNGIIFITNGSAIDYEIGDFSAFYTVEEEVFTAVNQYLFPVVPINEFNEEKINVYPNPATQFINIKINSDNCSEYTINIIGIDGKCWLKANYSGSLQLNISSMPAGCYSALIYSVNSEYPAIIPFVKL